MKQTVSKSDFIDAFKKTRPENFSYAGLESLFEYLEDFEANSGEEMELDVIAICCDFTEYENLAEFQSAYGEEYATISDIEDRTLVIRIDVEEDDEGKEDGSFIVQDF
ncbi:MAG: hypothetical protein UU59_C0051G0008 [candidate division WWE3 bacterium GW2011_GWE1_41_27]|uniref:Uncharacterized protein n=1 Tax=candidate division WWE3 bacterium GW2011_GWE1_41_27 TaxID=1619131 RepID=A0A0G0YXU5_UNCKA|nr:MAG: hypothetical protein UU59_C0051G0008 [candidate division WWE3 bacterium GW2011_GWE1_41_27]